MYVIHYTLILHLVQSEMMEQAEFNLILNTSITKKHVLIINAKLSSEMATRLL